MASSIRSKMRCVLSGLMHETASKRVYKSKHCVLFMTFRPSQRTLFMARRNWVLLALIHFITVLVLKGCTTRPFQVFCLFSVHGLVGFQHSF